VAGVGVAIDATLGVSLLLGLPVMIGAVRRPPPSKDGHLPEPWWASPGFWLVAVVAAGYLNQVLFTIYIMRVHGGDTSFIGRYLPAGWFALATDNRLLQTVAADFPDPNLLAGSVLRVQAVLELPFVVLACLTVCRWWDRRLYQSLAAPLPLTLTCGTYTVTFCLIEWSLRNPYTGQDLALRALSCLLTVVAVGAVARRTRACDLRWSRAHSPWDLVVFGVSAAALGYLVLTVYDTVLLYNLAHVGGHLPGGLTAVAVLVAARRIARRRRNPAPPSVGIDTLATAVGWFIALFSTVALPVRYSLGFASGKLAAGAFVVITMTAVLLTGREVSERLPSPRRRRTIVAWIAQSAAATLLGAAAASLARLAPASYPEAKILLAAALFLAAVLLTYVLTDPLLRISSTDHQILNDASSTKTTNNTAASPTLVRSGLRDTPTSVPAPDVSPAATAEGGVDPAARPTSPPTAPSPAPSSGNSNQ
jgi:hypothetical protein